MRVLVYQQLHAGHCYHYLHYLLPELLQITDDVVVALSAEGIASSEFTDLLAHFANRVRFDGTLPSGYDRVMKRERWKLHTDLRAAVTQTRPDYVLAPSGDPHTDVMGVFRLTGLGGSQQFRGDLVQPLMFLAGRDERGLIAHAMRRFLVVPATEGAFPVRRWRHVVLVAGQVAENRAQQVFVPRRVFFGRTLELLCSPAQR